MFTKEEFFRKIEEGVSKNVSKGQIINSDFCEAVPCKECEIFKQDEPDCAEVFDEYFERMVRKEKLKRLLK